MLIVTSTYQDSYENVKQFASKHNLPLLVYNKNDTLQLGEETIRHPEQNITIIDIPNYGRCDYSFLYYIIKNYNHLPEKVLFTKANFTDQSIMLEYALNNENDFTLIGKHIKYGILNKEFDKTILTKKGIHINDLEDLFYNRQNHVDPCFQSYLTNDFYQIVYGNKPFPDDYVINMGHGPVFCVSKKLVLNHDISVYEKLINTFYPNQNHWTKWEGHSEEETYYHVGKRYHDNLQRFWVLLFVQEYKTKNIKKTDWNNYICL
jgi:hypothetical protein